jgi:hypothetical protein
VTNRPFSCQPVFCQILRCHGKAYWIEVKGRIISVCEEGHITMTKRLSLKKLKRGWIKPTTKIIKVL